MISAVAKKRLAFRDDKGSFITVKPGEFVSLPDYVRKDPMFAWAVQDGSLVVSEQVISAAGTDVKEDEKDEAPAVEASPEPVKVKATPTKKTTTKKKAADK